jgi:short-chain fatty acids transporter
MSFSKRFEQAFRWLLPSPLAIALLLTLFTFVLAWAFTESPSNHSGSERITELLTMWEKGLWNTSLLAFTVQMMLILVLGHVLALSPAVARLIDRLVGYVQSTTQAVIMVSLVSMLIALLNWGLGLVVGAILARKAAQTLQTKGLAFNYGLLGAAGYCGLMVWHGGLSGSAPLKAVESGHLGSLLPSSVALLPDYIPLSDTLFSSMNISNTFFILLLVPAALVLLNKYAPSTTLVNLQTNLTDTQGYVKTQKGKGMERLDLSGLFSKGIALLILTACFFLGLDSYQSGDSVLSLNFINLLLLACSFFFHTNLSGFSAALGEAIQGVSGILIQFPLYFGIIGLMQGSGMVAQLSLFFAEISSGETLPIFTFFSAALVNLFVPSGGGQWSIQGPVLLEACINTQASFSKTIMAMSYGDQLTNMLQPFWALPLLGITGLKAKDIIPYSFVIFLVGLFVYISTLMFF